VEFTLIFICQVDLVDQNHEVLLLFLESIPQEDATHQI